MFWIHGGGFTSGAGSASTYNGLNIVREGGEFVYVSINYRLAVFGFLSNQEIYDEDNNWKSCMIFSIYTIYCTGLILYN